MQIYSRAVYTAEERKYCVTYDGVSAESSLKKDLPGIIEFNDKIESGTLSVSSYYTPMDENVEFYEKKVKGKRYTVKDKPLTLGYYGILDNLDNCIIECYPTKKEAEKEAEILNGFTIDIDSKENTMQIIYGFIDYLQCIYDRLEKLCKQSGQTAVLECEI